MWAAPTEIASLEADSYVASSLVAGIDDEAKPQIIVRGSVVKVLGAEGKVLTVYDITGKVIHQVRIDSPDKTLTLRLSKGVYIVSVEGISRKISVN